MIIGILRSGRKHELPPAIPHRLVEAGHARGHEMVELHEPEVVLHEHNGHITITHLGVPLPKLDVIINRPGFVEEPSLHAITTSALRRAGYKLVNGSEVAEMSKNKLTQHLRLSQAGIAMPRWAIARRPERALEAAKVIGFPLIIKVAFGTHGKGVFLAQNEQTFSPIVDYLAIRDGNPVVLEEFIEEANSSDLRVFVLGGKVLTAMQRVARPGDVRANASLGGVGQPVVLTADEITLAIKATAAFDLDLAGVDMLRSKNGPLVMEVNANPGFKELERATGVDVAGAIIEYLERQ